MTENELSTTFICRQCGAENIIDGNISDEISCNVCGAKNQIAARKSAFSKIAEITPAYQSEKNACESGLEPDSLEPGNISFNKSHTEPEIPSRTTALRKSQPFTSKFIIFLIILTFMAMPFIKRNKNLFMPRESACVSNMKTIYGAAELYMLENTVRSNNIMRIEDFKEKGYIKNLMHCSRGGRYVIKLTAGPDKKAACEVSCTHHGILKETAFSENKPNNLEAICKSYMQLLKSSADLYILQNGFKKEDKIRQEDLKLIDQYNIFVKCPSNGEYSIRAVKVGNRYSPVIFCSRHGSLHNLLKNNN